MYSAILKFFSVGLFKHSSIHTGGREILQAFVAPNNSLGFGVNVLQVLAKCAVGTHWLTGSGLCTLVYTYRPIRYGDALRLFKLIGALKEKKSQVIGACAKFTKADEGRALDAAIESIHRKLKTVFGGKGQ